MQKQTSGQSVSVSSGGVDQSQPEWGWKLQQQVKMVLPPCHHRAAPLARSPRPQQWCE